MKSEFLKYLRCPTTGEALKLTGNQLVSEGGSSYEVIEGIPSLVKFSDHDKNEYALTLFKNKAHDYDKYQHLSFETFKVKEEDVRNSLIDKLNLRPKASILELNAGTGRDSLLIQKKLKQGSKLHVQDISMDMLLELKQKFKEDDIYITQSNACFLPYKDHIFDGIYSFAGVGMDTYADSSIILKEIVRVAKVGAKVVIGGLSMAPWLRESEFGKILINHNTHYANKLSIKELPVEARDASLSWILNGAGFCMEFTVGKGEPEADFDYEIPGVRGGTLRTRYAGKLEGVSPEMKELAYKAREKAGISMYDFLNEAIRESAQKILKEDER